METKLYFLQTRYYDAETGRFISPDSIEYLDPECINGLNLYCYCYNNPLMLLDPNGKFPFGALIFGAIFSLALSYGEDVYKNLSDGFDLSDFNTFDGNEFKYICAAIGGALSGVLGAYDKIYLSFIGDFVGNMVENAYTFSDWKNVRKTIWTSLIAGSVSGISTAISNRLTKLYFDNKVVNSSNEVQKEMKKFMKKNTKLKF